jgi:HEPN domain-containing protein
MEMDDKIKFWLNAAKNDSEVMQVLFDNKKFADCLFFGHLSLEKTLKAVYIKKKQGPPPFIHDLLYIAKKSDLEITEDLAKDFKIITGFNINARYDDYKNTFYKEATKEYTVAYIEIIKEIKLWLENQI